MFGGKTPDAPPPPPPPPNAPVFADSKVQNAGNNIKAAAAGGMNSTIGTSAQGVTGSANTAGKSLLGQ